jgi:hypothetical protein
MLPSLTPAQRRVLIWMAVGVVALILVAGGLGTFTLQPGKYFALPTGTLTTPGEGSQALPGGEIFLLIMRGVLALMLILSPVALIFGLINKETRKRVITYLIAVALFLLLMNNVKPLQVKDLPTTTPIASGSGLNGPIGLIGGDPLPPKPPAPSNELVLIASILLVVAVLGLAVYFGRRWLAAKPAPMAQIAREAERARDEISSGHGVEDAIIRTYRQMSRIVAEARELHRPAAATPREFEEFLVEKGIPAKPLADLTHLFEDVRYGGVAAGAAERQRAIDSLTAIAAACRVDEQRKVRPA